MPDWVLTDPLGARLFSWADHQAKTLPQLARRPDVGRPQFRYVYNARRTGPETSG